MVKLSSLGDVVHTLAAAMDMHQALPDVHIDWVVEDAFAPILRTCPAIERVIPSRIRRWRKHWWTHETRQEWRAFMNELRAVEYDAVIDLQGLSKSALVSHLAKLSPGGKRFAMANRTHGSAYESPTRWVADVLIDCPWESHAVQRARHVCAHALGYSEPHHAVQTMFAAPETAVLPRTVALVHGSSRPDKCWPVENWISLGSQLVSQGFHLALPQSNTLEERVAAQIANACPGSVVWSRSDVYTLTQQLAACVGVVGVDSGPSHIAVALGLPHVQIYKFDTAWRTGPLQSDWQKSVYAKPQPGVDEVMQIWQSCLQAHTTAMEAKP